MDLAKYIRELILLNECVILPGFGGFETQYTAAKYNNATRQMMPPSKQVHFRSDYVQGSGVLEDHLSKCLRINTEQANLLITEYVTQLNKNLDNNNEAIISGVGLFTRSLGDLINFTPFQEENYLVDSFGLDALPYQGAPDTPPEEEKKQIKIKSRSSTLLFISVGIGLIAILLTLTVFISSRFDLYLFNIGDQTEQNDLIIIGSDAKADTAYQTIDNTLTEATDLKKALYYSESTIDLNETAEPEYFIVAGSFKTHKNAENNQKQLLAEGYQPQIIENGGYLRVCIGSFVDKPDALHELQRLRRQLDRSVWLLHIEP